MADATVNIKVKSDDNELRGLRLKIKETEEAVDDLSKSQGKLGESSGNATGSTNGLKGALASMQVTLSSTKGSTLNLDGALSSMKGTISSLKDPTSSLKGALSSMQGSMAGLVSPTTAAVAAVVALSAAAIATVAAFARMTRATADAADEQIKAARSIGIAVERYGELDHALSLSGTSADSQSRSFARLSRQINENSSVLTDLGIATRDANGNVRSMDDVLNDVADRFAGMEDGAQKTAEAVAIFGGKGTELISFLNAGSEGIAEMSEEANALGLVFSTEAAEAAEEFNDGIARLGLTIEGLRNQVFTSVIPIINEYLPQLQEGLAQLATVIDDNSESIDELARFIGEGAVKAMDLIVKSITPMIESLNGMAEALARSDARVLALNESLGKFNFLIGGATTTLELFVKAESAALAPTRGLLNGLGWIASKGIEVFDSMTGVARVIRETGTESSTAADSVDELNESMFDSVRAARIAVRAYSTVLGVVSSLFSTPEAPEAPEVPEEPRRRRPSPPPEVDPAPAFQDNSRAFDRAIDQATEYKEAIWDLGRDLTNTFNEGSYHVQTLRQHAIDAQAEMNAFTAAGFELSPEQLKGYEELTASMQVSIENHALVTESLRQVELALEDNAASISAVVAEISTLENEEARLNEALANGLITQDEYDSGLEKIKTRAEELAEELENLGDVQGNLNGQFELGRGKLEALNEEMTVMGEALSSIDANQMIEDATPEKLYDAADAVEGLKDMAMGFPSKVMEGIGSSIAASLSADDFEGDNLKEKVSNVLGDLLVSMGSAAIAMGAMNLIPPPLNPQGNPAVAAVQIAGGITAVALGRKLGGKGGDEEKPEEPPSATNTGSDGSGNNGPTSTTINLSNQFGNRFDARETERAMADSLRSATRNGLA